MLPHRVVHHMRFAAAQGGLGLRDPVTSPPSANNTSLRSSVVDTMVNTVSQAAKSSLWLTTVAPYSASGSALLRVRFQMSTP